eukprot:INCI20115.1.p1 GENE.INCI20115.1~~INCI20115.1.p1  ORF type:complete len:360 (+),score=44.64 INCI20115.1:97-1176(+)
MASIITYFSVFLSKVSVSSGLDVGSYFSKFNPKSYSIFSSNKKGSKGKGAPSATCLSKVRSRLFTREDNTNVHKILGLLSLWSFIYRYFLVFSSEGTLGFDGSAFDWVTMALHLALSSSSLIFHVLKKRNKAHPMMIWQEYRLHAIIFSLRCFVVFSFAMLRPLQEYGDVAEGIGLYCAVMFNHVLADIVTKHFGVKGDTAVRVREDDPRPWYIKFGMRFYSYYQFMALGAHLSNVERLGDLGFNTFVAIQSSAFLMTLYRKNLIRWYSHAIWYTACLLLSAFHILYLSPNAPVLLLKTMACFLMRTQLRMNKYVIWALYAAVSLITAEQFHTALNTVQQPISEYVARLQEGSIGQPVH